MAVKRTRDRDRTNRRRENEKEVSIWKEYKIIIQLLVCIMIVIAFVFTQGMVVHDDKTVRDYVKAKLSETTNLKETMQYVKQFVDAKRLLPESGAETAPVSASVQPGEAALTPETTTAPKESPTETPVPEASAETSPVSEPIPPAVTP